MAPFGVKFNWSQPLFLPKIFDFDQTWHASRGIWKTYSCKILALYDLRLRSYGLPKFRPRGHFRLNVQTSKGRSDLIFQDIKKIQNVLNSWKPGEQIIFYHFLSKTHFLIWCSLTSVFGLEYLKHGILRFSKNFSWMMFYILRVHTKNFRRVFCFV